MTRKKMPKVGRDVITPDGKGTVTDLNIVKETVFVRMTNGDTSEIKEYPLENITRIQDGKTHTETIEVKTESSSEDIQENENRQQKEEQDYECNDNREELSESKPVQAPVRTKNNITAENKNREKNRKPVLGQPVRRENPNKKAESNETKNMNTRDTDTKGKETNNQNSWAEALQKAIQAIDRDK